MTTDRIMSLANARHKQGLSIADLAKAAGVNPNTIWRIQIGGRTPTFRTVLRISQALGMNPRAIREFQGVPLPGDPCPCGCGNFRGPDLRVIVVCQFCGKSRPDEHCTNHPRHCRRCSQEIRNPKYPEALEIIRMALARLGITLKDCCAKARINANIPSQWVRGTLKPRRQSLQALADALGTPELMDAIPFRTDWYLLTCTGCGNTTYQLAGVIRRGQKGPHQCSYAVDPKTGTGTYLCNHCFDNPVMKARWNNRVQRIGYQGATDWLQERMGWVSDEAKARGSELIKIAQAATRGRPQSEEHRRKRALSMMKARPKRRFCLCRQCLYLHAPNPQGRIGETHGECWNQHRSENMTTFSQQSSYPSPIPAGLTLAQAHALGFSDRIPSSEELVDMWELIWRHLVEREQWGGEDGLLKRFGIGKTKAKEWVNTILALLPPDNRGGEWLTKRAEMLRYHAEQLGYAQVDQRMVS